MLINLLTKFASLKLTFIFLMALLFAILFAYNGDFSYLFSLTLPLVLLALNLIAAIITHKAFQQNLALLLFHITLLMTVSLIALSQLTYLDGQVSLNEGEAFTGKLDKQTQGIFHQYTLAASSFVNLAVQLDFTPFVKVSAVRSRLLVNEGNTSYEMVIGEHKPLIIKNYRFYVTRNVGFSAEFTWQPSQQTNSQAVKQIGTVNFPPFLSYEFNQTNTWKIPSSERELWFMLVPEEDMLAQQGAVQLTPMKNHYLVVRYGEQRDQLRVGQQLKFAEGILTYHGLRTWMGYKVHYDPFKAYLLACSILTVLCLAWFFGQKFSRHNWLD